jgi:hypothetical protein
MKTLCICWGLAAAIVLLWQRVPSFEQRVCPLALQPPDVYDGTPDAAAVVLAQCNKCPVVEVDY